MRGAEPWRFYGDGSAVLEDQNVRSISGGRRELHNQCVLQADHHGSEQGDVERQHRCRRWDADSGAQPHRNLAGALAAVSDRAGVPRSATRVDVLACVGRSPLETEGLTAWYKSGHSGL